MNFPSTTKIKSVFVLSIFAIAFTAAAPVGHATPIADNLSAPTSFSSNAPVMSFHGHGIGATKAEAEIMAARAAYALAEAHGYPEESCWPGYSYSVQVEVPESTEPSWEVGTSINCSADL